MRKAALVCVALLAAGGFAAAGHAQVCLDFTQYVDGLELTVKGKEITGYWRNYDGMGSDSPVFGIIRDGLPLLCNAGPSKDREDPQNPGKAGVVCLQEFGCEDLFGWDWYILLDGLDGSLDISYDIGGDDPPGACGADDTEYEVLMGACPFGPQTGGPTLMSATRERLREQGARRDGSP